MELHLSLKVKIYMGAGTEVPTFASAKTKRGSNVNKITKKETHRYLISILKYLEGLGIKEGKWSFKLIRRKALPSTHIPKWMLWLHHVTVMDGQSSVIYLLE